jgi:hypothetical protein
MFQVMARDQLEPPNASPSATPWRYLPEYSTLFFIFLVDDLMFSGTAYSFLLLFLFFSFFNTMLVLT